MQKTLIIVFAILISTGLFGCMPQASEGSYYTCFGGVKVESLAECDFSHINISLENCEKVKIYETASIITNENDVHTAFISYMKGTGNNFTFVSSKYYTMMGGKDYYRFNFYDYGTASRRQQFIDDYGVVYDTKNCVDE